MARGTLNPNVEAPEAEHTRRAERSTVTQEQERVDVRTEGAISADALDATESLRSADARREVPRLRTDAANPNKDRALPSPSAQRRNLSSSMKKEYNSQKTRWTAAMPKTGRAAMERTVRTPGSLQKTNNELHRVVGQRSELPPNVARRVARVDRAIQSYEATNERQHVVYAVLRSPTPHGNSRNALKARMAEIANGQNQDQHSMTFDSYIPATHTLGNIKDTEGSDQELVMEIRTRSGAYLGTSDTTPNADHIVGRGRTLRPVGMSEVSYVRSDGSTGARTVVQMDDVSNDGRTTV